MKKLLLLAAFAGLAGAVSALDINQTRTLTVSVDALALFSSELSLRAEYRFAATFSAGLGVTYGYGGRAAHPEGSFWELAPEVKTFGSGLDTTSYNWYVTVQGKARWSLLDNDVRYGAGAGLGYAFLLGTSPVVIDPSLTSQLFFGDGFDKLKLRVGGNVGVLQQ
jgi:hypothetical protein